MGSTVHSFSESMVQILTKTCDSAESDPCRNDSAALILKLVAMASILLAGATGVTVPLTSRRTVCGSLYAGVKSFAAGVILATGFVHMLSGASDALTHPCLPKTPWRRFPFPGFFAMVGALLTLLADLLMTRFYERKEDQIDGQTGSSGRLGLLDPDIETRIGLLDSGAEGCGGAARKHAGEFHGHVHAHEHRGDDDVDSSTRHVVVSQVLELGIVSHSVIIGLSLGVSQSPCTIRPLIAALSFHQLFEGMALGGCISEAGSSAAAAAAMACCFAVTTPIGIAVGTAAAASSWYNPHSAGALVVEGVLDSLSAGILVYVALVDLIAADFLSKKLSSGFKIQIASYCSLFLGATLMSSLAIWA